PKIVSGRYGEQQMSEHGKISHRVLSNLFTEQQIPRSMHSGVIQLLYSFGLAFPLIIPGNPKVDQSVIPLLLPPSSSGVSHTPRSQSQQNHLVREMKTARMMSEGVIGRCISRLWRYAVVDKVFRDEITIERGIDTVVIKKINSDTIQMIGTG